MAALADQNIAPETAIAVGTETIFIVEDEPVLREMARIILENCGYRILEAESGKHALNVWNRRTCKVDLLLTDMMMPDGVSGMELAERLLCLQPELKIIFTSGLFRPRNWPGIAGQRSGAFSPKTLFPLQPCQHRPRLP